MKIILLRDVPNVGKKYEVKDVSDGYALNYLMPRKLAEVATPGALKGVDLRKKQFVQKQEIDKTLMAKTLESIKGVKITLNEKANEKGHLFAQVHKKEVINALKAQKGIELSEDMLDMEHPIKEAGEHKITIKIDKKSVEINLEILPT